jgi:hypothetical protein
VYNNDPTAVQSDQWQTELVDLELVSTDPIDLGAIKKLCIGIGERGNTTTPGGTGTVVIDDITLGVATCTPENAPLGDLNQDCLVDFSDLAVMANHWLETGPFWCGESGLEKHCRYTLTYIGCREGVDQCSCPQLTLGAKCAANACADRHDCDQTIVWYGFNPYTDCKIEWQLIDCAETLLKRDCRNP